MDKYEICQFNLEDFESAIKKTLKELVFRSWIVNFSGNDVDVRFVCQLWGITPHTLYIYIKKGFITPKNPGSSKLLFDMHELFLTKNPRIKQA